VCVCVCVGLNGASDGVESALPESSTSNRERVSPSTHPEEAAGEEEGAVQATQAPAALAAGGERKRKSGSACKSNRDPRPGAKRFAPAAASAATTTTAAFASASASDDTLEWSTRNESLHA
jgi:hypothetical protein